MRLFLLLGTMVIFSEAAPRKRNPALHQIVADSVEVFSRKLYQVVSKRKRGNLIISPVSVDIVLSMAALGAGGHTKRQMYQVLDIESEDKLIKSGYQSFIDKLNKVKRAELKVANKIFIDNKFEVKPEFKAMTGETFRSASEELNFSNSEEAASTINDWCANMTDKKIQKIIEDDAIDESTSMILVNAVYFKGQWKEPFKPSATCERDFYIDMQTTKKVPFMYQWTNMMYGELPHWKARFVEIFYVDHEFSMIIVLPDELDGLSKVEQELRFFGISVLLKDAEYHEIRLHLPKFKIESTIELNHALSKMGMSEMFLDNADFSGISDCGTKVNKVVQKAFFEINEEGAEATAATHVVMGDVGAWSGPKIPRNDFDVNRPFMYFIVDKNIGHTDTVLFQGKVMDPASV